MNYLIRKIKEDDLPSVLKIFNYFTENSMAAYGDEPVGLEFVLGFKEMAVEECFKVIEYDKEIIGFGLIRKYAKGSTFKATAVLTYFIMPEHTGKGLGTKMLHQFTSSAKEKGIKNLLAHISSENETSLNFHRKHGFTECGRFKSIGVKFEKEFDVVWVQKVITCES